MDGPIPGSPPIPRPSVCEACGRVVERECNYDKAVVPVRRRTERPLREHLFGKISLEKVQRLIVSLKERIIYLYMEKERWKELSQRRRK